MECVGASSSSSLRCTFPSQSELRRRASSNFCIAFSTSQPITKGPGGVGLHSISYSDETRQWKWRKMMKEMETCGSAVPVLHSLRKKLKERPLSKELVIGTLMRFKQMKEWKYISEILEWLRSEQWWHFSQVDFNLLMLAYGKQGNFENAESTLKSMNKAGVPIDVAAYTALIEAYGKAGHCSQAYSIFKRIQLSGPEPSVVTCQTIMKILVDAEKYDEAEEIFRSIMEDKIPIVKPDRKMFHLMIHMYKKMGRHDEAYKLYEDMISRGIPHCTVTFNSLMTGEKGVKKTDQLFNQVYRSGLRPDVVSYTQLINSYGKARDEESAQAVFDEMIEAGVRPTQKAYNVLLDAYARCGLVEGAKQVFRRMRRDRCSPDLCSYTTMLSAYVNASDMEGAEKFFVRMKNDGFSANAITYGSLIKGYGKINNLELMVKRYEEMCSKGIKANETIFTNLMDAHGRNADFGSAVAWFKEMLSSGCKPDQKAKNILYALAKTVEEKQEAKELVESLQS